jgi:death-on-curing protein
VASRPSGIEWPDAETLLAFHAALIETCGGPPGVRDASAIDPALARPLHLLASSEAGAPLPGITRLAAALAFAIWRIRHPFVDGDTRVALAVLTVTLGLNGLHLEAADAVWRAAQGDMTEEAFAAWAEDHTLPAPTAR